MFAVGVVLAVLELVGGFVDCVQSGLRTFHWVLAENPVHELEGLVQNLFYAGEHVAHEFSSDDSRVQRNDSRCRVNFLHFLR